MSTKSVLVSDDLIEDEFENEDELENEDDIFENDDIIELNHVIDHPLLPIDINQNIVGNQRKPRTQKVYPPSDTMFTQMIQNLCDLRENTRKIITLMRETQKCANREVRDLKNQIKKQKEDVPVHQPRGFATPSVISDEMVNYLINVAKITHVDRKVDKKVVGQVKIEPNCALARNELVAALCQHFKINGMRKNNDDKRKIFLDQQTTQLFKIDTQRFVDLGGTLSDIGEPIITYFDLSKYLGQHCRKKIKNASNI